MLFRSAAAAYLRLLLAPASPFLSLFSPLPFLSFLLALRKALSSTTDSQNPSSSSGHGNPRKRKNQRQQAAPSFLPEALPLLADAAGRLPLGEHPDARRSLIDTATELAAFNVLAAILRSNYHANALQDVVRALAPVVLSGVKSAARAAAFGFGTSRLTRVGSRSPE